MTNSQHNKTGLVTGASRGIGRACALTLADAGFDVVACARTMVDGQRRLEGDESITVPGGLVFAQRECQQRGLLPGWPS